MSASKSYARWKYAEEAAKDLVDAGHVVRIEMVLDVEHANEAELADGESYVHDDFLVFDLGPRP